MERSMPIDVVTIDGPAGAGKSSVARALAQRLGLEFLNTGATYRAVALKALRDKRDLEDEDALVEIARKMKLESIEGRTYLDGEDVTDAVRDPIVSRSVRYPANAPGVRALMVQWQRAVGLVKPIVTEGRDQGTAVFPDARCKFYLDASPEERAKRRVHELQLRGESPNFNDVLAQINERDKLDSERAVGPLCQPADAVRVNSDGKSIDDVVNEMEKIARQKLAIFS